MKIFKKLCSLIIVIFLIITSSCQRDLDYIVPDIITPPEVIAATPVQASVQGVVTDENNNPVPAATVRSGANITTTDSKGIFRFNNIQLDKYASVVSVEYNGYFKGIRTFSANYDGSVNYVKLKLIRKALAGTIDAAAGGSITLPDNSGINFLPASIIIKSSGQVYTGPVNVFAAPIDPTASDISATIPGSFQATDTNFNRVILKSYGMMAIQLESQSGELLQIANGKTAKLRLTIPATLTSSAPTNIPLWSLNETDGLWKEEGQATKNGNYYEGDVSHFSFWNCDVPNISVYLEMTLRTANGPLSGATVAITRVSTTGTVYGYTDSTGHVGGMVFSGEQLSLQVMTNCHEAVYSQVIGPFSSNTNLGIITLTISLENSLTISGYVRNCSGQPVTNGTAAIYFEGWPYLAPVTNGNFSTTILRCTGSSDSVIVKAFDSDSMQISDAWTGSASSGIINTDTLTACGNTTLEHITYMLDGATYSIVLGVGSSLSVGIAVMGPFQKTSISGITQSTGNNIDFDFTSPASPGAYSLNINKINQYDSTFSVNPTSVDVTAYGGFNEPIQGTFSGQFLENGNVHAISGDFLVLRP